MQSVCPPVPRCAQAQTFLDNLNNRARNNRDLSFGLPVGKDRNSDLDEKYHELAFMNGLQPPSRDRDHRGRRRDGGGGAGGMGNEHSHISAESIQRLKLLRQQHQQQQQQPQPQPQPQQRIQQNHDQRQTHRRLSPPSSYVEKLGDLGLEVTMMENDSNLYEAQQEPQIEKSPRKQRLLSTPRITIPPLHTQTQASILPSPPLTASSPESPSSLAIHLYVHHHHHHHGQKPESNSAAHTLLPSPPLLSPPSSLELCRDDPMKETPPVVISPRPLPVLLPSLNIPESRTNNAPQPSLIKVSSTTTIPTDSDALSWYSHPHTRPSLTDTSNPPLSTAALLKDLSKPCHPPQPQAPPRRRHRQQHPSSSFLLDPAMSAQILGTISSTDLGRMYVHAAHHLHSHQPIRRYVLMKQIMTQAELIQYGRLRADMPRAPGPSTGALPKRTGFGTDANKGDKARPKVSSNLVKYNVLTAEREDDVNFEKEIGDERSGVAVEEKKKLIKVPWTQSLPSLASLSTTLSLKRTISSRPEREKQNKRPHSWYGGMLGGNNDSLKEEDHEMEEADIKAAAGVGVGSSVSSLFKDRKLSIRGARRSSYSEPDLYSVRRLEELELGTTREEEESEDDERGLSRKDRVEEEAEEMMDYWTMIRSRNNPSRRRQIRTTELEHLRGSTATTTSTVYSSQSPLQHPEYPYCSSQQQLPPQHYQQQAEFDQICLEPYSAQIPMQHPPHPLEPLHFSQSRQLFYDQEIQEHPLQPHHPPQLEKGHPAEDYLTSSSISKPKGINSVKKWSSKRRNSQSNLSLLPSSSLSSSTTSSTSSTSTLSSPSSSLPLLSLLPESQAVSGMVMLSLLFGGVYLVHGTNHLYNLQSAFLSIIL
ncbi:hypothetical protein EMPS_04799 [Entomortierella parvispora]|uniref:Uncharacterized protein n=1 Tax=Entomortierella parvispora TaxID=205924 RepID=A0A9P3LVV4_9FUNG|nr:hypothetical protein EMPS_04799 [Entomortierella parvispora]